MTRSNDIAPLTRALMAAVACTSLAIASSVQAQPLSDGVPSDPGLFDTVFNLNAIDILPAGVIGDDTGATITQVNFNAGAAEATDRDFHYVEANFYDTGTISFRAEFFNSEVNVTTGVLGGQADIEVGSTLNMSGGEAASILDVFGTAYISGGAIGSSFDAEDGSVVHITGGTFGDNFDAKGGSLVYISDGAHGASFDAESGSVVNITGGVFGDNFNPNPGSNVNISGGSFGNFFRSEGDTVISGGSFGPSFWNFPGGVVNFIGTEFFVDGVPVAGLTPGGTVTILDRGDTVTLTGTLLDGSTIDFDLDPIQASSGDWFDPNSILNVSLAPEPSTLAVLALSGVAYLTRRSRD